jgi:hypothetical protein
MFKRGDPDPAHPALWPVTFYRTKCACCDRCWFNRETGHCLFHGPFDGYEHVPVVKE